MQLTNTPHRAIDSIEWEDRSRRVLEDVPFDTDLGVALARDAIRVSRGELTETAFHDRYHDAVIAEFGYDDRPTKPTGETDE